eukprot:366391-Chlamydomonas_euryale.AAC.36
MSNDRPEFRPDKSRSKPGTAHHAAETGNLRELQRIADNAHVAEVVVLQQHEGSMGMTPLLVAVEYGQREVVQVRRSTHRLTGGHSHMQVGLAVWHGMPTAQHAIGVEWQCMRLPVVL